MEPHLDTFKGCNLQDGTAPAGVEVPNPGGLPKDKKQKPMSKKLSSFISQCSGKMTEIMSWQAKLDENKSGLILVGTSDFMFIPNLYSIVGP